MSQSSQAEQAARDDAHLRSLGIKPELQRTLGFLSNFAVAFSYISVSTGTYTLFAVGLGVGGPAFFWAWPIVILGQLFVALNFAELSSHFPVAGSIYQWSKRLSHRTLGWFTGWIYFWAGVLTTTAVAITVPLVLSSIMGFDLGSPDPTGMTTMSIFLTLVVLVSTTLINAFGVRLLSLINNIGVGAEILAMLVFALILLVFFRNQPFDVLFQTAGAEASTGGAYGPVFLVAMFMALFVVYGFDTAGTFGEETLDAGRQAPRGVLSAILLSGVIGAIFLLGIILSFKDMGAAIAEAQAFGLPIGTTIIENMGDFGRVYLVAILAAVYVCTLAIQGATVRLMFSMGRDGRMPLGRLWGKVNEGTKTPANAGVAVGILAAVPILVSDSPAILATAATGMIYTSYFLCNLGVLLARRKGWPHKDAWFNLRGWGTVINVAALVWGGAMIVNFSLWQSDLFGALGTASYGPADAAVGLRDITNPLVSAVGIAGIKLESLPIPVFEFIMGVTLLVGAVYYRGAGHHRAETETVGADAATGEKAIA